MSSKFSRDSKSQKDVNNDPPKIYRLDTLPIEVLGRIFSNLSYKQCQKLRGVSRSFNFAVAAWQGIHIRVTNSNWDNIILRTSDSFISEVTFELFIRRLDFNKSLTKTFVENLRYIEFSEWNTKLNFVPILEHAPNLETLVFGKLVIERDSPDFNFDFSPTKSLRFDLRNLKVLKLVCGNTKYSTPIHMTVFLAMLRNILKDSEVQLRLLEVTAPYHIKVMLYSGIFGQHLNKIENSMHRGFTIIREILLNNRGTLETVILQQNMPGMKRRRRERDESRIIEGPIKLKLWPSSPKSSQDNVQLQEIDLRNINRCYESTEFDFLSKILINQRNLRKLVNISPQKPLWNIVHETVELNCHSLTTIYFDYTKLAKTLEPPFEPLSACVFKNCSGLRKLTLFQDHKYCRHDYDYCIPLMQLYDVHLLPKSLRSFSTALTLCFDVPDVKSINFDIFKRLERFELLSTPWFSFNSITLEILGIEHFLHILMSMSSVRTIHIMTKPLIMPRTARGLRSDPMHTDEDLNVKRTLIDFVQNDPGLRYNSRFWKRQRHEFHRNLEIIILAAFRDKMAHSKWRLLQGND